MTPALNDDACYRAVQSRDRRFDGVFYTAVTSTGIYCRPSCPARTPARANVTFHATAAAAQTAGFRACKRCLPDATPGSPDWDIAADVAGRAMRLIGDGLVDREGVEGLAHRVGYTSRHLGRLLTSELGAGPLALARARRAQTARVLIETTDLPFADVAFAAGFASIRQFNQTVREVYDSSPTDLRGRRGHRSPGALRLRIPVRTPYAGSEMLAFLAGHANPGVEIVDGETYARTLRLPHGHGTVVLRIPDDRRVGQMAFAEAELALSDLRDTTAALERVRRLLDADCDPVAVDAALGADDLLADSVRRTAGLRVPGTVDGAELAVRTVIGQQVSVAGATTVTGRLIQQHGEHVETGIDGLTHLFPSMAELAATDPEALPMPGARGRTLVRLCAALAAGDVVLDRGADRDSVRESLLALPGIGPWTADYIAMRALAHPDVLLVSDLATRAALSRLAPASMAGLSASRAAKATAKLGERWRPWRSYAQMHLWHSLTRPQGDD